MFIARLDIKQFIEAVQPRSAEVAVLCDSTNDSIRSFSRVSEEWQTHWITGIQPSATSKTEVTITACAGHVGTVLSILVF